MTAPLEPIPASNRNLSTGLFGGQKQVIAPRGAYNDPTFNYMWNGYADLMSGTSDFGQVSTTTGVPVGTPEVSNPAAELNVGGGGTAAYMMGSSPV